MHLQGGSLSISERPVCEYCSATLVGDAGARLGLPLVPTFQLLPPSRIFRSWPVSLASAAFARALDFFLQGCMGLGLR